MPMLDKLRHASNRRQVRNLWGGDTATEGACLAIRPLEQTGQDLQGLSSSVFTSMHSTVALGIDPQHGPRRTAPAIPVEGKRMGE